MCLHVSPYLPSSRLPSLRPLRGLCSSCSRPAINTLLAVLKHLHSSRRLKHLHTSPRVSQLDCHDHFINSIFSDVVPALFDSGFTNPHGLLAQLLTVSVLSRNHSVILRSLVSACLLSSQTFALVVVYFAVNHRLFVDFSLGFHQGANMRSSISASSSPSRPCVSQRILEGSLRVSKSQQISSLDLHSRVAKLHSRAQSQYRRCVASVSLI